MIPATNEAVKLFHDGALALAEMETNGIKIDTVYLEKAITKADRRIKRMQEEMRDDETYAVWRRLYGKKANLGSYEQLGRVLFTELGYECKERTATGRPKVDADALADVDLPFVKKWVEAEKLKDAKSTFLQGIQREVDENGFLHPFFHLHTARSFRSSGSDPNPQNWPIRDAGIGEIIRRSIVSREDDWNIVETDFSQLEVRVAACYNHDPVLIRYIEDKSACMHRDTAGQIFFLKPEEIDKKTVRHCAKNQFVFPQFYGSYYVQCAKAMWNSMERMKFQVVGSDELVKERLAKHGIRSRGACDPESKSGPQPGTFEAHIQKVEKDFWEKRFKVYTTWKKQWWQKYQMRGWLKMHTGFVCHGILNRKKVINYPIQGSAFHCLLWSICRVRKELKRRKMRAKLMCQIHDSLIADVPVSETAEYLEICKRVMTVELPAFWTWINCPLEIEAEVSPPGASWFEKASVSI